MNKIGKIIKKMADPDIFNWLGKNESPSNTKIHRAATIVADRLCGTVADPIIRNAQERRQLQKITEWLVDRGYTKIDTGESVKFDRLSPGNFAFHQNIPVNLEGGNTRINVSIDAIVMPLKSHKGDFPILIEAKSAGDFTNVNKRRKEEAVKMSQLKANYGNRVKYILFLCGYFDSGYLGYEAAEGIDWIWEHRIDDFEELGL